MFVARKYTAYAHTSIQYITLAEAKTHLRVTSSADDSYITDLVNMAIDACAGYLGYSVRKATARYGYNALTGQGNLINPINGLNIPNGNYLRVNARILAVANLYYVDDAQVITAFAAADWIVSADNLSLYSKNIFINSAPTTITDDNIKYIVEVTEGFELASAQGVDPDKLFPTAIKQAALLLVAQYYDNRQAIVVGATQSQMLMGFEYLLDFYKIQALS